MKLKLKSRAMLVVLVMVTGAGWLSYRQIDHNYEYLEGKSVTIKRELEERFADQVPTPAQLNDILRITWTYDTVDAYVSDKEFHLYSAARFSAENADLRVQNKVLLALSRGEARATGKVPDYRSVLCHSIGRRLTLGGELFFLSVETDVNALGYTEDNMVRVAMLVVGLLIALVGHKTRVSTASSTHDRVQEELALYKAAFRSFPEGAVIATYDGTVVDISLELAQILGALPSQIVGQPIHRLAPDPQEHATVFGEFTQQEDAIVRRPVLVPHFVDDTKTIAVELAVNNLPRVKACVALASLHRKEA